VIFLFDLVMFRCWVDGGGCKKKINLKWVSRGAHFAVLSVKIPGPRVCDCKDINAPTVNPDKEKQLAISLSSSAFVLNYSLF